MDKKCLILVFLGWNLKKLLPYLKSTPSNLSDCKFREKTKMSQFGTKNASLGYFWAGIWKKYCHIWNQHPRLCLIAKFYKKTKIPKFGTKNALFGYFWTRILKNYCHIGNQLLRICLLAKFCEETKMPNLGLKMPFLSIFDQKCLIWVFLGKNLKKNYCHIWNQHPKISPQNAWFMYFWAGIWKKIVIFEISTLKFA